MGKAVTDGSLKDTDYHSTTLLISNLQCFASMSFCVVPVV